MNSLKKTLISTAMVLAGLLFVSIILEIGLRFFPVNEGMYSQPVNQASPVMKFQPNRTFTWSRFPNFSIKNTLHANNCGFINDQDYNKESPLPLIAVIGDSYVEAAMVPYPETGFGRLDRDLSGSARVYSFGVSGAPLSQYLAFAKYARDEFAPKKMIFVIVGNDFDESLYKYNSAEGLHYFHETGDDALELRRSDYSPGLAVIVIKRSFLLKYLLLNVQVLNYTSLVKNLFKKTPTEAFVGQTTAQVSAERLQDSKKAVDAFFGLLPEMSGLEPQNVLLAIDGMRPHLYSPKVLTTAESSYFAQMRRYFVEKAENRGYPLIDMQTLFIEDYKINGRRFEYERDGHWNPRGHDVFFRAVINSGFVDEYKK